MENPASSPEILAHCSIEKGVCESDGILPAGPPVLSLRAVSYSGAQLVFPDVHMPRQRLEEFLAFIQTFEIELEQFPYILEDFLLDMYTLSGL